MISSNIILLKILLFSLASCEDRPTRPTLHLYATALSKPYLAAGNFDTLPPIESTIIQNEKSDITKDKNLINVLKRTKAYCADGVWRLFSSKNFLVNTSSSFPNGFTFGRGQFRHCDNLQGSPRDLASMRSFRFLGPVDWTEFSMTVYNGYFFSGNSTTAKATDDLVEVNFPVKSYVITAPVLEGEENKNPTYCSPWIVEVGAKPVVSVCYNLCKTCGGDESLPKMYMEGLHKEHVFHSIKFVKNEGGDGCSNAKADVIEKAILPFEC